MKIALISAKGVMMGTKDENDRTSSLYSRMNNIESLHELMSCPNSPLLTIAALADDYFELIDLIDEEIETIDFEKHYDMVCMSFMTQQASRANELAEIYRKKGAYLVAGGMHPTNLPDESLEFFDTVFIGECEHTWHEFMRDFKAGRCKKIYKNSYEVDMNNVPMPRYDLLKIDRYRTIPVQISRGCPHDCEFCASTKVYGPKYRNKTVDKVMGELQTILKIKKNPHIYFTDDNMFVNKRFTIELIKNLQGEHIRWMTHTDISVADHNDVLNMLYHSGCRKIVVGFESINPESLIKVEKWKYNRLMSYADAINKIQSYGIGIWGTFIVGLDNDDISIFDKVIEFTLENNLYGAMISVPTPFPGSRFFDRLDEEKRILTKHWGNYTLWNVVVEPTKMTVKELQDGFAKTLESIYSATAVKKRMNYFKDIYASLSERV